MKITALISGFLFLILINANAQRSRSRKTAPLAKPAAEIYVRALPSNGSGNAQDISWLYISKDGLIIKDPKFGVNPVDIASEKKHNAAKTGRYTIEGNTLRIDWDNGKHSDWVFEKSGNEYISIDNGAVGKPAPLPANYRIKAQYNAASFLGNDANSTTIDFSGDGSFSQNSYGGVVSGAGNAVAQDMRDGNYVISGNTIRLNYADGEKKIANIALGTYADGKKYVLINKSALAVK